MFFSSGNSSSRKGGITSNAFKLSTLDLSTGAGARLPSSNPGSALSRPQFPHLFTQGL